MKDSKRVAIIGIVFVVLIVLLIGMVKIFKDSTKGKTADSMLKHINVIEQQPTKASISLDDNTLFDELPDISKYPQVVTGKGDIVIEIMTSPEKAGENYESWLIDVAEKFNKGGFTTEDGQTIGLSIRPVTSGLAADYIISNKH